jgi:hypothetical protein
MDRLVIKKVIVLFFLGLSISCIHKTSTSSKGERVGETVEVDNKEIDWEAFDPSSTISKTEIKSENLQGLWKAYKGIYRFDQHINGMELTEPMIIEVKEDTYRRNLNREFEEYIIKDNLILKVTEEKVDTGIINKITPNELTISWKDNLNYTRYYYTR